MPTVGGEGWIHGRDGDPETNKKGRRMTDNRWRRSRVVAAIADERGSATAEYAVATMAAVGFAGLLVVILRGDEVRQVLTDLVRRALSIDV